MDQFGRPILLLPYALDSLEEQFVWFFFFFSQIIHIFWHNSTFWTTSVKCLLLAVWSIWTTITNSNTSQWMLMIFLQCDSDGVCVSSHFRNLPLTIPEILCLHMTSTFLLHGNIWRRVWQYFMKFDTSLYNVLLHYWFKLCHNQYFWEIDIYWKLVIEICKQSKKSACFFRIFFGK